MLRYGSFGAALLLVLPGLAPAQVASGPAAGDKVAALKVFAVTGPRENKEVDYATEVKDQPVVYLFIQAEKWDRPMARFVKELDKAAKPDGKAAFQVVAVWLSEKPDEAKDYLPRAQQSLQLETTALTVFQGSKEGPENWGLNSMAHLTAVVAGKAKVAAAFGYQSVNETDVKDVQAAVKKAGK
jgi:hypothetical protein